PDLQRLDPRVLHSPYQIPQLYLGLSDEILIGTPQLMRRALRAGFLATGHARFLQVVTKY
ncbi:unnamed protein product, partial [Amoebophrya sp. A25]